MDYTVGKSEVCEIHHFKMVKTDVPIVYGLFPVSQRSLSEYEASTNSFPHTTESLNPSCLVQRAKEGIIYTCPKCEQARQQWELEYDAKR